ncbi:DUF1801 domain-containing protein [Denitromonas sp. IR12]|uniref:DUF1801 domain-containing protein n=1 Tax=Denitromonas iodatirespirans TaxID=2795389 RepID=A0A944H634_DENI1|nr:DUF1801 domain-containing protein [Denitromonas iodatirespirans]
MPDERSSRLLDDIRFADPAQHQLVVALRALILELSPSVTEAVKYGGLMFSVGKPFCGLFAYARHVSLEFSAGASLDDRFKMLEGQGKLRRHLKLTSADAIAQKHVREYLRMAFDAAVAGQG